MNNMHTTNAMLAAKKEDGRWVYRCSKGYYFTDASYNYTFGIAWNKYYNTDTRKGV